MPLVMALLGGLIEISGSLVGRVLLSLGLGFVTYSGFDVGVTWLSNQIKANMAGMPADMVQFLGWLWVVKAIGLLFSAYSAALAIKMAGSTSVTKLVSKK